MVYYYMDKGILLATKTLVESIHYYIRGQTFTHVRVVVRAEFTARTKTEEKYISGRLHKALEKKGKQNYEGVNTRKLSFNTRKILRNSLPYIFRCFLIFCVFVQFALLCIPFGFIFPRFSEISHMRVTFDRGVIKTTKSFISNYTKTGHKNQSFLNNIVVLNF